MNIYQDNDDLGGTGGIWEGREVDRFRKEISQKLIHD